MLKIASLTLICLMLAAQSLALQVTVDERNSIKIDQALPTLMVDSDAPLTLKQLKSFSIDRYPESIKPQKKGSWYKLSLSGDFNNQQPKRKTIIVKSHIIRHLHFYLYDKNTLIKQEQLGIADPDNILQHTNLSEYQGPAFDFFIENNRPLTLLIYKQNDGPGILPMTIYSTDGLLQEQRDLNFFWGGIICMLLVMAMYNIIVYAMHPNKAYLWYMSFHSLMIFYFGGLNGFGFVIFPLEMQLWLAQNIMMMNFILIFIIVNFASVFLNIKINAPKFYKFIHPISILSLIGAFISLLVPEYLTIPIFSITQLLGSVVGIGAAISCYRNGFKPAKYFLISWVFTISGGAVGMGTAIGLLPINFFTLHGFLFGTLSELFLFSVALAHRMKGIEMEMLSQSFTYPDTKIGNFSFLKGVLPEQIKTIKSEHQKLVFMVVEIHGLKELVSLYGPQSLSQFYRTQTGLISDNIKIQPWSVSMSLPSNEKIFLIALPGEQVFLIANIPDNNSRTEKENAVKSIVESITTIINYQPDQAYKNIKLSFTIGCHIINDDTSFSDNFRQAQVALLSANNSKKYWDLYSEKHDKKIIEQVTLIGDLERSLINHELQIYIQPQFSLNNNTLNGGEVLLRWHHEKLGLVSPQVFIPLAEQSGFVFQITKFVIEETFKWLKYIQSEQTGFYHNFELSINLSALDLAQPQLISHLQNCLFYYGIESRNIILEVTESAVLNNADLFLETIRKLKLLGFRISIDDFGTGYSSMQYLQTMEADEIKIDMAFIRNIDQNLINQKITNAIIQLAHSTGAITVAEGIQSDEERLCLEKLGCNKAQGFYWTPAVNLTQFEKEFINKAP